MMMIRGRFRDRRMPPPPWQTAYERAARETFVIVLLAAALAVGLIVAAVRHG